MYLKIPMSAKQKGTVFQTLIERDTANLDRAAPWTYLSASFPAKPLITLAVARVFLFWEKL